MKTQWASQEVFSFPLFFSPSLKTQSALPACAESFFFFKKKKIQRDEVESIFLYFFKKVKTENNKNYNFSVCRFRSYGCVMSAFKHTQPRRSSFHAHTMCLLVREAHKIETRLIKYTAMAEAGP